MDALGKNCEICRNDLDYELKFLETNMKVHNIQPISYSNLFTKIKSYLGMKKAGCILKEKNCFYDSEASQQTKMISVIHEIFFISMEILAETADNETINHMLRTRRYVKELTECLSESEKYNKFFTKEIIDLIVESALIHDVGKIGISQQLLMKKNKLTTREFEILKTHTTLGLKAIVWAEKTAGDYEISLKYAKEMAYFHHERWDGSGYPNGISGYNIPISARIMALADVYDALTSERVYKDVFKHEDAVKIILENEGTHFDPNIVHAFIKLQDRFKNISN